MTLDSTLGAEKNLLEETPEHARLLRLHRPVLRDAELEAIRQIDKPGFKAQTLSTLFKVADGGAGLRAALDELCREASQAIAAGANILILSDRGVSPELAPIPSLLATGAVHHHLIREESRTPLRLDRRDGRGARGRAFRAAGRLRGRCHQSVSRASRRSTTSSRTAPYVPEDSTAANGRSRTTSRRSTSVCSRSSRRWASRRSRATAAHRSSRRSAFSEEVDRSRLRGNALARARASAST